jgi:DNA transformation protein and related proteins
VSKDLTAWINGNSRPLGQESQFSIRSGILKPNMPDTSFTDFVLDQLAAIPGLRAQKMFGGHGLYSDEQFFGILIEERLYFKTDGRTRADYLERGMEPFTYSKGQRIVSMNYFEVPPDVLESRESLVNWASRAIEVAAKREAKGTKRPRKRDSRAASGASSQPKTTG